MLEGVENVLKGFMQVMTKFGVTPIQALGEKFDPAFHNAVMQREDAEAGGEPPRLGDEILFVPNYAATLAAFTSPYVEKQYIGG